MAAGRRCDGRGRRPRRVLSTSLPVGSVLVLLLLLVVVPFSVPFFGRPAFADDDEASRVLQGPVSSCTSFILLFFGGFEDATARSAVPPAYEGIERVLSVVVLCLRFLLEDPPFLSPVVTAALAVFDSVFFALAGPRDTEDDADATFVLEEELLALANAVISPSGNCSSAPMSDSNSVVASFEMPTPDADKAVIKAFNTRCIP